MHHTADLWAGDSDSSDSSDGSYNITRAEAVRAFPEAAHQALAATLGLIYYKIRNEVGEGPHAVPAPRPPKRQQDDGASGTGQKSKPVKMPRRPSVSDNTFLHRLVTGPPIESKSSVASEEYDKLGWKAFPDSSVSDDAINKLRSIDPQDIGTVLRALEQGRLKLKPSRSEKLNMSPTETTASKAAQGPARVSTGEHAGEVPTVPNTVPTQPASTSSKGKQQQGSVSDRPASGSDSDSSAS